MRQLLARAHQAVAWLILCGIVLQFFFVGIGIFAGVGFGPHEGMGWILLQFTFLLFVLSLLARLPRSTIGVSTLLFVMTIAQIYIIFLRDVSNGFITALHPVNALVLLFLAHSLARGRYKAVVPLAAPQPVGVGVGAS
jgi:hypothetical protein